MTEQEMQDKIKELESKNTDLKNENADRRIKNKELESTVNELTKKVDLLDKEKSEIESKQGNEMESIKQRDAKIKELEKTLKEHQVLVESFKEQEQKEIENIKSKIPENIREKFSNINDKTALMEIAGMYSERKPNSPLSEIDSIVNKSKSSPKDITLADRTAWLSTDPVGYNQFVKDSMKIVK